jgi:hypothetical protein
MEEDVVLDLEGVGEIVGLLRKAVADVAGEGSEVGGGDIGAGYGAQEYLSRSDYLPIFQNPFSFQGILKWSSRTHIVKKACWL